MLDGGPYVARNAESRERLRAVVSRLSEADYGRPIGHGWTVGAALAHIAYWDGVSRDRLLGWEQAGPAGIRPPRLFADSVNDEMLPIWLAATPSAVAAEVITAAEAVDEVVARLSPELVEAIRAVSPRSLDRSLHRDDHLDEVDRALGEAANG